MLDVETVLAVVAIDPESKSFIICGDHLLQELFPLATIEDNHG